jgi:hypothetical protein
MILQLFCWLCIGCGWVAHALVQPPETPFLRTETGSHTASIKRIDVDRAERFLVTASEAPRLTLKRWGYKQFPMKQIEGISFPTGWVQK